MKGKAAVLARFVPTPLQEVPLDLTPTAGTVRILIFTVQCISRVTGLLV